MDLQSFQSALQHLAHVPAVHRTHVATVAEGLTDADRATFIMELQAQDKVIGAQRVHQRQTAQELERAAANLERTMQHIESGQQTATVADTELVNPFA